MYTKAEAWIGLFGIWKRGTSGTKNALPGTGICVPSSVHPGLYHGLKIETWWVRFGAEAKYHCLDDAIWEPSWGDRVGERRAG